MIMMTVMIGFHVSDVRKPCLNINPRSLVNVKPWLDRKEPGSRMTQPWRCLFHLYEFVPLAEKSLGHTTLKGVHCVNLIVISVFVFLFNTVFEFLFFWCLCISSCLRICIFTVFVFLVAFNFILPPGCTSCWPPAAPTTLHWPPSLSEEALQLLGHFWTTQKKTVWTVLPCFQFSSLSNLD